jgi:CheY-like chemotaxis protein
VRVDPERRAGAEPRGHAAERAHRDRVVAAEDERQLPLVRRLADEVRDEPADLLDRPEVAARRTALVRRLRHRHAHVAPVGDVAAERADARFEIGIADRRGAHVDAAPAGTEVDARADDRNRLRRFLDRHGGDCMRRGMIRVLIADDDELFLDSLQALIDRQPELGVVATASNGLEAIERARELAPDAVVLDLHMPLLDGVGALGRLRASNPHLCLIVLTGDSDPALHRAAERAGADAVLEKHEMARALVDRIARGRQDGG